MVMFLLEGRIKAEAFLPLGYSRFSVTCVLLGVSPKTRVQEARNHAAPELSFTSKFLIHRPEF